MSRCKIGVQFNGPPKLSLPTGNVLLEKRAHNASNEVGIGSRFINLKGF